MSMLRCGAERGELNGSCQRSGYGPCARPSGVWHAAGRVGGAAPRSGLTSDTSAKCSAVSLADKTMLLGTVVGLGIAPILDIGTQWDPLSADIDQRSNAGADDGTQQHRGRLRRADRAD